MQAILKLCAAGIVIAGAPLGAKADLFKPSQAEQIKLGANAAAEIRKKEKILPASDVRVKLLRSVGQKLVASYGDKKSPWKFSFDVIQSKEVNAFALPGGPIFFYTGILDQMETVDELAGILGHEIQHVRKEHWARQYAEQQKQGLGLTALILLGGLDRKTAGIINVGADLLINSKYSRRHETQADDGGFSIMVRGGYNPQGIVNVFQKLGALGGSKPPEFLSSHPSDKNRVKRLTEKINKLRVKVPMMVPLPFRTKAMDNAANKTAPEKLTGRRISSILPIACGCGPGHTLRVQKRTW